MTFDPSIFINPPEPRKTFALLIAGSRTYSNYAEFSRITDRMLSLVQDKYEILIIEGEASGADSMARRYAQEHKYRLAPFPADWDTYGRSAGYLRNEQMADELTLYSKSAALYFWDGESRGTKHCIGEIKKRGIPYKVFNFRNGQFMKVGDKT